MATRLDEFFDLERVFAVVVFGCLVVDPPLQRFLVRCQVCSYRLYSYRLYSYGLYSYGIYSYGLLQRFLRCPVVSVNVTATQ